MALVRLPTYMWDMYWQTGMIHVSVQRRKYDTTDVWQCWQRPHRMKYVPYTVTFKLSTKHIATKLLQLCLSGTDLPVRQMHAHDQSAYTIFCLNHYSDGSPQFSTLLAEGQCVYNPNSFNYFPESETLMKVYKLMTVLVFLLMGVGRGLRRKIPVN